MSAPIVPPRPARAAAHGGPTEVKPLLPHIPPRPARKADPSPDREAWARSPLNLPPSTNGLVRAPLSGKPADPDAPRRPPSINLPSEVGQEGLEYTSYDQLPPDAHGIRPASDTAPAEPEQTKNVSADVPLQQPKASHPQSTAKSRIAVVTRTDSTQAAAAGIGQARPDDDVHTMPSDSSTNLSRVTSRTYGDDQPKRVSSTEPHPLRARSSFNRSASSLHGSTPRPPSLHSQDHHHDGIPEIGQQIPLYPNAGDVQAPSPAPGLSQHTPGIGFFNDGSSRAHHRKRSSRHEFGPPGSYGLHGHGTEPHDRFEKQWIAKHPSEAAKECAPFTERPETALSSDQLNRIVSQNNDIGMGTSREMVGTPTQEIAFEASEQYASLMTSPQASPAPVTEVRKRPSSGHQPPVESPLRSQNYPFHANRAVESEDEDVIHVDPSSLRRGNKITGGGAPDNTVDLGPTGGNTAEAGGRFEERGEGTPILASDEVVKRPGSAFLQPAVDPEESHPPDEPYYDSDHGPHSRRSSLQPISRPSSRPSSIHGGYQGGPIHRFTSHDEHHGSGVGTPLAEIEEYEPLFPENEESERKKKILRERPNLLLHHFPSRDMWEDTPDSLKYQATVQTPEPPHERPAAAGGDPAQVFETPEQERMRRAHNPADKTTGDEKTLAKPQFKPGVQDELQADRPSVQRFPSQDVWEDTPDSMRLVTTVSAPQMDETKSPPEDRPTTAAMPGAQDDGDARSTTGFTQIMRPSIPARPERKSKLAQEFKLDVHHEADDGAKIAPDLGTNKPQMPDRTKPVVPERPKPSIPARSARSSHSDHTEGAGVPLSKTTSASSAGSAGSSEPTTLPPVPKAKPIVPARPAGGKIAAMQANFMNDLNNRLKLGPQGPPPKVKEPDADAEAAAAEEAREPLSDARKGRARGPARRKPAAASPSMAAFSFSNPMTLFQIDEADELNVPSITVSGEDATAQRLEKEMAGNEARNTEEPTMLVKSESMSQDDVKMSDRHVADVAGGEDEQQQPPSVSVAVGQEGTGAGEPELGHASSNAGSVATASAEDGTEDGKDVETAGVHAERKDVEVKSPEDGEAERI